MEMTRAAAAVFSPGAGGSSRGFRDRKPDACCLERCLDLEDGDGAGEETDADATIGSASVTAGGAE